MEDEELLPPPPRKQGSIDGLPLPPPKIKKASAAGSGNGLQPSGSGLSPFQSSPPAIPSVLIGEAKKKAQETVKRRKTAVASLPKEKTEEGGVGASFMSGLNKFNEGIFKIPQYLYDVAAIPQNFLAELTNTPELRAEYEQVAEGKVNPLGVLDRLGDYFSEESKVYQDKVKKYDKGVFESLTSGNWKDAGEQVLNNMAQSAPSIAGMFVTGGIGNAAKAGKVGSTLLTSLPFASSKNAELEGREDIPDYIKPINATFNGLAEVVFDQEFGTKAILDGVIKSFKEEGRDAAVQVAKDFATGYAQKAIKKIQPLTSAVKNSIEEMATQFSQNIVDKATINPDKDITEGVLDAAIIGGVTGGSIQTVGSTLSGIYNTKKKAELSKQAQLRNDLITDLDNPELDDDVKDQLTDQLERVNDNIAKISDEAEAKLGALPEKEQAQAVELQQQIASIEDTLGKPSVTEGTKEALTEQLQQAQDKLDLLEETSTKLSQEVIAKAETDLEALKQVDNKVKKYEASMKRLTDAKNAKQITESEFNDIKSRFDDVMGDSVPKEAQVTPVAQTDVDIETRMSEIEGNPDSQEEFNALEKEMEKRERGSVFNVGLENAEKAIDALVKKDKEQPNGYGSFIEQRDARESKSVIRKYLTADELTDEDLKRDFKDAMLGNPDTWYADGLKLREALNEASRRGINTDELVKSIQDQFVKDGYSVEDANQIVARRLASLNPNQQQNAIQEQTTNEVPLQPASGDSGEVAEGIPESEPEILAEESESLPEETALRNADIQAKRKELGFEPFEEVIPRANADLLEETTADIREEGFDAKTLIDNILTKSTPITDTDVVALKQYQLAKENELVGINDEIIASVDNPTALKNLIDQRDIALNELNDAQQAGRKAGTITARALQARKIKMMQDFSLANMFIRKFNANGDAPLSEQQKQEVTTAYADIRAKNEALEAKQAELEAKIAELETKNVDNLADESYKKIIREQKKAGQVRQREAIDKEIDSTLEALRKKLKDQRSTLSANPIPLDMIPDVIKLAKLYAEKGVLSAQEVADNIYEQLKDVVEGLTSDHVKAVIANNGTEDARLKSFKTRTRNRIEDLRNRTNNSDFKKAKREAIRLDEEALELRDALEKAKYDYDVAMYKDELANRSPEQKAWDTLAEVSGLFRAAKSTADISAVLRQGLVRTVSNTISRNPTKGVKMFWEMLRQTVSEKRYNRWMYDLQSSPEFAKMKDAGLYIADTKNPKLTAKEEAFQSNWINLIPYYGKEGPLPKGASKAIKKITGKEITKIGGIVKGSERAYASYLNMQRVDVFMKLAQQLEANGKTFESDPQAFKEAANFANEVTGRGDLGPVESWKGFLSFSLFSPRLIASRVRLLTNPINPVWWKNTPKVVKQEYVKDLGKLSLAAATVLWGAGMLGFDVEDEPTSSDFLKLRDGDTRLDVLGGFQQYMTFGSREVRGETTNGFGETKDLTNPQTSYDPTRLSVASRFGESKLSPFVSITLNLARGKDYLGRKYTYKDLWKEVLPLSAADKVVSTVQDDPQALHVPYKYLPFSLLGVGTSAYPNLEKEFPANDTVESLTGEKIKLTKEQLEDRQKFNDEFITLYGNELSSGLTESGKDKSDIHRSLKARANKYSEAKLKEKYSELIK